MATFQPPPTFAEVVLFDKNAADPEAALKSAKFNPIWLKWFVDIASLLAGTSSGSGAILHNSLGGLQGGTGNQEYHLTSSEYSGTGSGNFVRETSPSLVTPILGTPTSGTLTNATGLPITGLAAGSSANLRSVLTDEISPASGLAIFGLAWAAWTPTRTSWTDVGSPTVTARYTQIGNFVLFQVKVVPGTTTATTGGTSYISLPVSAGASGVAGDASMGDLSTLISVGNCVISTSNSRCYVPTQAATGDALIIAGWYEV